MAGRQAQSVAEPSVPAARRSNLALATLGVGAFVVATAELVIVGILDLVAKDLDVSTGTAGLLVTAYAAGRLDRWPSTDSTHYTFRKAHRSGGRLGVVPRGERRGGKRNDVRRPRHRAYCDGFGARIVHRRSLGYRCQVGVH
jgi:hypothetical protein